MQRYMGLSVGDILDWAQGGVSTATDIRNFFTQPYVTPSMPVANSTEPTTTEPGFFSSENLPMLIGIGSGLVGLYLLLRK